MADLFMCVCGSLKNMSDRHTIYYMGVEYAVCVNCTNASGTCRIGQHAPGEATGDSPFFELMPDTHELKTCVQCGQDIYRLRGRELWEPLTYPKFTAMWEVHNKPRMLASNGSAVDSFSSAMSIVLHSKLAKLIDEGHEVKELLNLKRTSIDASLTPLEKNLEMRTLTYMYDAKKERVEELIELIAVCDEYMENGTTVDMLNRLNSIIAAA